ncbi:MAG: ABC transporter permease subunit [Deltaproteobacteria bacterium]|nr:ABC transporter permease subunit [Deltaproteobacteria bacterium]
MMKAFYAVVVHELLERMRDKWVLVISCLFGLLSAGVGAYGTNAAGDGATALTGPSLVTLASLFAPLVALMLGHDAIVGERERNTLGLLLTLPIRRSGLVVAKFIGRSIALAFTIFVGLGMGVLVAGEGQRSTLLALIWPTLLLGMAFLSLGILLSSLVRHQLTAVSLSVAIWFLLVFFFDLGLLGAMVVSDGALPQQVVSWGVALNPAGLYRIEMMSLFGAPDLFGVSLPSAVVRRLIWVLWLTVPIGLAALRMSSQKSLR